MSRPGRGARCHPGVRDRAGLLASAGMDGHGQQKLRQGIVREVPGRLVAHPKVRVATEKASKEFCAEGAGVRGDSPGLVASAVGG